MQFGSYSVATLLEFVSLNPVSHSCVRGVNEATSFITPPKDQRWEILGSGDFMISRLRGSERMVPHISAADSARERGNKAFIDSDYATAVAHYSEALNQYDDNEAEARVKTYTNRAMAHDKLGNTGMAIADCDAALALNSSWTKARYRRMCLCAAHQEWARVSSDGEALLSADSGLKPSELTHLRALMKEAEAAQRTDAHNPGHETSSSDATISASNVTTDESGPSDSDDDDDEQNGAIGAVTTQVHKLSFSPGSADATSVHPAFAVAAANNNSSNNSSASPRIEEEEKEVSNPDGDVGNSIKGSGNGNGSSSGSGEGPRAGLCGACGKDAKSLCKRCNHTVYCSRSCQHAHWKFHKAFCTRGAPDPSPQLTMQTRRGLVGLYNAGNSCYLNSAVACLSHCYPLTRHLISGRFTAELNRANALGEFNHYNWCSVHSLQKAFSSKPFFATPTYIKTLPMDEKNICSIYHN